MLALGCRPVGAQELDEREDIVVETRPLASIPQLFAQGEITHALFEVGGQYRRNM